MSRITEVYEKYSNTIITVGSYFLGGLQRRRYGGSGYRRDGVNGRRPFDGGFSDV